VLLRAVDDVEKRFSEPVFSKTSAFSSFPPTPTRTDLWRLAVLSDHSPAGYEACCDLLATAVL
jgi:hypothetical protein